MSVELQNLIGRAKVLAEMPDVEEAFVFTLERAKEASCLQPYSLLEIAELEFSYAALHKVSRFFLCALDTLERARELDPRIQESFSPFWHLLGNIHSKLGQLLPGTHLLEQAIDQFSFALSLAEKPTDWLYWQWAEAWVALGKKSSERSDFEHALTLFQKAETLGCSAPAFFLAYGQTLILYGKLQGDPQPLAQASLYFAKVYEKTEPPEGEHFQALCDQAFCAKQLFLLTHLEHHFERANQAFREAILNVPDSSHLWLEWIDLYFLGGWLRKDPELVNEGLEKLAGCKLKECSPVQATGMLGYGLLLHGLFEDSLEMIKEGKERIEKVLLHYPGDPHLRYLDAFGDLVTGIFFSDGSFYAGAARFFSALLEEFPLMREARFSLFRTYLCWGLEHSSSSLAAKCLEHIAYLSSTHPFSTLYLAEWGSALLKIEAFEESEERRMAFLEEAILRLKAAMQLSPTTAFSFLLGRAYSTYGALTNEAESLQLAVSYLADVYEYDNNEPLVCYQFALALLRLGKVTFSPEPVERASALFCYLNELEPEHEELWLDWGYSLLFLSELVKDESSSSRSDSLKCEAEKKLLHALELGQEEASYHLACLYALTNQLDSALLYLKKAEEAGFLPSVEKLKNDPWLVELQPTSHFKAFIDQREPYE